jgi:hypothetical protein
MKNEHIFVTVTGGKRRPGKPSANGRIILKRILN